MTAVRTPAASTVDPGRRSARILAIVGLPPAVVAAVIGLLAQGVVLLVVLFVVVLAGVVTLVWTRAATRPDDDLGGAPADRTRHARLYNLVDGLCVSAGVHPPSLRVLDVPGCNLAVTGRDPTHATLVVTAGLLEDLTRMELEGVVAAGIVELRHGDVGPATVAAAVGTFAVRLAVDPARDARIDEAAVALTRYPPGLTAAYRKLEQHGTVVAATPRRVAHLWLADPDDPGGVAPYRSSLQARIDALAEI